MISIIVCSVNNTLFSAFEQNISVTAGVPFEIIRINNTANIYSMCSAYNEGALKATYPLLCFAHEDIEMLTMNWGRIVSDLFNKNKDLGLVGVAGTGYKPLSPSGWWYENADPDCFFTHYIQSDKKGSKADLVYSNPENKQLSAVVCVDGLWFCTPRHIALELKFDECTFKGFHCYDVDYSLSVFQHYQVAVSYEVLIKHYSEGSLNRQWVNDTLILYKKWKNVLPLTTVDFSRQKLKQEEKVAFDYFVQQMLLHLPLKRVITVLWLLKNKIQIGFIAFLKLNIKVVRHLIQ